MRQIRRHTSTPFPRIFLKNPARWAEPPGQARTRSPSQFPGHTAIGTKALGLLFLRRKIARDIGLNFANLNDLSRRENAMAISVVPQSASVTITQRPTTKLPYLVGATAVSPAGMRFWSTKLRADCQCQITGLPTDKPAGWTLGLIQLLWVTTNWAYYRGQNNGDGDCFLQYARPPARPEQECRDTYSSGSIFVETMPQFGIFQFVAQNFYRFPIIMTASFKDQPVITHPLTRFNSLTSKTNFLREVQIEWHFCTVFSLRNPEPLRGSDAGGV